MYLTHLFIPIETKVRELYAKTLLGCIAAEKGFIVVIGKQANIREALPKLPKGIYLDKSVVPQKAKSFRDYFTMGHRIAAWCEEGIVFQDSDTYVRRRVSAKTLEFTDLFFAWGKLQKEAIIKHIPQAGDKIVISGNPRVDILRPQLRNLFDSDVGEIRKKYGQFLLINTNFSKYNHFNSRESLLRTWKRQGKIKTPEDEKYFWEWSDFVRKMFETFINTIPYLSHIFPQWNIIVRPHPSENHETWKEAMDGLDNVRVVHEGSVIPWILASDCVMHNSCTTGLEAYLCGKPVVAFCPITSNRFISPLPNQVSRQVFSREQLVIALREIKEKNGTDAGIEIPDHEKENLVKQYIAGLEGKLASDRIVDSLLELAGAQQISTKSIFSKVKNRLGMSIRIMDRQGRKMVNRFLFWRAARNEAYQRQKFSALAIEEIREIIADLSNLTGRFDSIKLKELKGVDSCYILKGDDHEGFREGFNRGRK